MAKKMLSNMFRIIRVLFSSLDEVAGSTIVSTCNIHKTKYSEPPHVCWLKWNKDSSRIGAK